MFYYRKSFSLIVALFILCFFFLIHPLLSQQKKIGLMWVGKSKMTNTVTRGFFDRMSKIAPDVDIEVKMNLKDMEVGEEVFHRFEKEKDGIVFLRSTGAKFMGKNPPKIPAFCGGCNNPVALGALKSMTEPGGNITGVTYYLDNKILFDLIKRMYPDLKSVGLILEKGHPSTAIDIRETRETCEKLGLKLTEKICATKKDLAMAAREFNDSVDVVILGNQALVCDNAKMIANIVRDKTVFSYTEKGIKYGALLGYVPNDLKLGRMLADSVVDVVVKGKKIKDVPVKTDSDPQVKINQSALKKFKGKIPDDVLKKAQKI